MCWQRHRGQDCTCREGCRGLVAQRAVRSFLIVILSPRLHELAGIGQPEEPLLVQAFVAEAAVEALAEGVLDRLARIDEVQRDRVLLRPLRQRVTD